MNEVIVLILSGFLSIIAIGLIGWSVGFLISWITGDHKAWKEEKKCQKQK